MDLDAFKMICVPAWPLCHKLSHYQNSSETRLSWSPEGCCGFGPEVRNAVLTMAHPPPPIPPLVGPHPAVLLWSDSQYCAASHGEEIIPRWSDQALAGTVRVVREEMYRYPHVEGRGKTDWQRGKWDKEQQTCCRYIQPKPTACLFWFPNSPVLQHYPIPFCSSSLSFSLPSCFGSLPFTASLSCKLKLVSTELLILVSVY